MIDLRYMEQPKNQKRLPKQKASRPVFGELEFPKNKQGDAMSPVELLEQGYELPSLGELCRGFFGRKVGAETDEELRKSILSKKGYGEWTSTWTRARKSETLLIEHPEKVYQKGQTWVVEGGSVTPIEQSAEGWVTKYDSKTGYPVQTSQEKQDAIRAFGEDASYHYPNLGGLRPVLRGFPSGGHGPFAVGAHCEPAHRNPLVGARSRKGRPENSELII